MLCFSYGSNMSQRRLQARVPSARFVAVAELPAHRLRFHKSAGDGSAKCDAEETGHPDDRVIGVIYEIDDAEKPDLDRHEALGFGYDEKQVELTTGSDRVQAWMYYATRINNALKPFHWYKDHVLIGARKTACRLSTLPRSKPLSPLTTRNPNGMGVSCRFMVSPERPSGSNPQSVTQCIVPGAHRRQRHSERAATRERVVWQAGERVKPFRLTLNRQGQCLASHMSKGDAMAGAALRIKHILVQAAELRQA